MRRRQRHGCGGRHQERAAGKMHDRVLPAFCSFFADPKDGAPFPANPIPLWIDADRAL
jgi:hypothetical protein